MGELDNKKMWESLLSLAALPKELHTLIEVALLDQNLEWNGKEIVSIETIEPSFRIECGKKYKCIKAQKRCSDFCTYAFTEGTIYKAPKDDILIDNDGHEWDMSLERRKFTWLEERFRPMVYEESQSDSKKDLGKIKYAGKYYDVLDTKVELGVKWFAIEDEPNHVDWVSRFEDYIAPEQSEKNEHKLTPFEHELANVIGYAISAATTTPSELIQDFVHDYSAKLIKLACEDAKAEFKALPSVSRYNFDLHGLERELDEFFINRVDAYRRNESDDVLLKQIKSYATRLMNMAAKETQEKDLTLTWVDMMHIHRHIKDAMNLHLYEMQTVGGQQKVYEDVLRRFNKEK